MKKALAAKVVGAPKADAAPLSARVKAVMIWVVVTSTWVPSGVPVFNGRVIVPAAKVPAGWMTIHCCSLTGVGTVTLKPVPGVYRLVATVGAAKVV